LAALAAVVVTAAWSSAQQLTKRDAESLEKKLSAVLARGATRPAPRQPPVRTSFSEREVNAYLKFSFREQLPKGVVNPEVNLGGERRVSAHAVVDLDAVRTSKERGWFDPGAYLTGSVDLHATGLLRTANGRGTFELESATVSGISIPKSLFQELVTYYSRSADLPSGFDLDKPFDLPAHIREVEIQRGGATVIQ
jgi:hypothetical protein